MVTDLFRNITILNSGWNIDLSELKSNCKLVNGDAKSLLSLFASFSLRNASTTIHDDLTNKKLCKILFDGMPCLNISIMLTKVLLEISLWCFTSPHFGLKVERQHQSSAELAFDVIQMGHAVKVSQKCGADPIARKTKCMSSKNWKVLFYRFQNFQANSIPKQV